MGFDVIVTHRTEGVEVLDSNRSLSTRNNLNQTTAGVRARVLY
ncbi:hypothetical protein [Larkinella arboricola]